MSWTRATDEDAALIAAYRRGEDHALHTLVQRHQTHIYRIALGLLTSPQDAEDATQEALMAMLSSLPGFRGDSRFSTWLYRLTINTCLKRRSRSARRREQPLSADPAAVIHGSHAGPDAGAGRRWLQDRVSLFLAALPKSYRAPVVLSDALDLPASEVAGILNLSLPAAKARVLRGRRRLRIVIENYCHEAGLSGWRELLSD